jgi:hypothetical protein
VTSGHRENDDKAFRETRELSWWLLPGSCPVRRIGWQTVPTTDQSGRSAQDVIIFYRFRAQLEIEDQQAHSQCGSRKRLPCR